MTSCEDSVPRVSSSASTAPLAGHYLVMLGTITIIAVILVPLLGGGDAEKAEKINTMLFASGINTLLQTWFGTRLPMVIGSSFSYLIPTVSITLYSTNTSRVYYCGNLANGDELSQLLEDHHQFITPLSVVPFITLTGLGLFVYGFPLESRA